MRDHLWKATGLLDIWVTQARRCDALLLGLQVVLWEGLVSSELKARNPRRLCLTHCLDANSAWNSYGDVPRLSSHSGFPTSPGCGWASS